MRFPYSQSPPARRPDARPSKSPKTPSAWAARALVFAALLTAALVAARSTPRFFIRLDVDAALETEVAPFASELARSALRREADALLRNADRSLARDVRTLESGWNAFFDADAAVESSETSETAAVLASLASETPPNDVAGRADLDAAFRFLSELDVVRVDRERTVFAVSDFASFAVASFAVAPLAVAPLDADVPLVSASTSPVARRNPLNRLRPVSLDRIVEREPFPARATRAASPLLFAFWAIWAFCPVGGIPVDAPFFNVFSDSFRRLTAFFRLLRRRLGPVFLLQTAEFLNGSPCFAPVPTLAIANVATTRFLN